MIKEKLKVFNKEIFGNLNGIENEIIRKIEEFDGIQFRDGFNEYFVFSEQFFWGRKAKMKWIK